MLVLVGGGEVFLFVCLFFPFFFLWARLGEVVILYAEDWIFTFIFFDVWMRCPAQGAAGSWVMLGLVYR